MREMNCGRDAGVDAECEFFVGINTSRGECCRGLIGCAGNAGQIGNGAFAATRGFIGSWRLLKNLGDVVWCGGFLLIRVL